MNSNITYCKLLHPPIVNLNAASWGKIDRCIPQWTVVCACYLTLVLSVSHIMMEDRALVQKWGGGAAV